MNLTIHQPQYVPWLPYFDKILRSDCFIALDHVQFQKNGMQNRNQIKGGQGAQWLTVPVSHQLGQAINETGIAQPKMLKKHAKSLALNYAKAPYFTEVMELVSPVFEQSFENLSDLNMALLRPVLDYLEYTGTVRMSSEMNPTGESSELIRNLCRTAEATHYISGPGGKNYMDLEDFAAHNIAVTFQEYSPVEYPQLFPKQGFVPHLSVLDVLFNCGPESRAVIEQGRVA